jgi:nitroimidazol reductase NimA-like FMN-containing flavoprotein (pyridoxamine 5'-phosphate oxidase superfamily)
VSRRGQITLSPEEIHEFIDSQRIVSVASFGPRGWPHVMPLWYVPRDGEVWIYTYAKSQKVKNLERDPRATLLIESGH